MLYLVGYILSFIAFSYLETLIIEILFFSFVLCIDVSLGLCYNRSGIWHSFIFFIFRDLFDVGLLLPLCLFGFWKLVCWFTKMCTFSGDIYLVRAWGMWYNYVSCRSCFKMSIIWFSNIVTLVSILESNQFRVDIRNPDLDHKMGEFQIADVLHVQAS